MLVYKTCGVPALLTFLQLAQLQSAFEEQKRLESGAARDIHDIEAMLRGGWGCSCSCLHKKFE